MSKHGCIKVLYPNRVCTRSSEPIEFAPTLAPNYTLYVNSRTIKYTILNLKHYNM